MTSPVQRLITCEDDGRLPDLVKTWLDANYGGVSATAGVTSVNTRIGDVLLDKNDVGLSAVNNTADTAKTVLAATKLSTPRTINSVAFDGTVNITLPPDPSKENAISAGTTAQYWKGDKTWAALDWTAVAGKPTTFAPIIGSTATTAVAGNDSRLTDARTPTAHTHTVADLSNASAIGKSIATATDGAAVRGMISAETSITAGSTGQYWDGTKTWKTLDKAAVGLSNVEDSKDEWKWVNAASRLSSNYKINGVEFNATQDITIPTPEMIVPRTWHDILAFGAINGWPTFETRTVSTWTAAPLGRGVFDQKDSTYEDLIPDNGTINGCRYTWNSDTLNWCQLAHFVLILNNIGSVARTLKYTIQYSNDGTTWADFGTTTSDQWSVTLDIPTGYQWNGWPYMRLLIERTAGTGGLRMTSIAGLTQRMGDQGGGRETEFPYSWDANRVVTFATNPQVNGVPIVTTTGVQTLTAKTLTSPKINTILESNGNIAFEFIPVASAINWLQVFPNAGTSSPGINAVSATTANLDIILSPKGTGNVVTKGQAVATIAGGVNAPAVKDVSGGAGLWIGSTASLPASGQTGVLYVTY